MEFEMAQEMPLQILQSRKARMSENQNNGETTGAMPPYIAFQSLKTLIEKLKKDGIPGQIDRSVLTNFSGAVGGQVITTLKFLSLIDQDCRPTMALEALVSTYDTDSWATALSVVIKDSYKPIFNLNLENASPAQFSNQFKNSYKGTEDVMRKCITFFLNAVNEAKIPISTYLTKNRKPRTGPTKKRTPKNANGSTSATEPLQSGAAKNKKTDQNSGNGGHHSPPPPNNSLLDALMEKFPKLDPAWPDDVKAKWFSSFEALMAQVNKN
jgi:hypothetical protein